MSEEPEPKSHKTMWTIWSVAVPLLYLLSVPWVMVICVRLNYTPKVAYIVYASPWGWLYDKTPLRKPLDACASWCVHVGGVDF